MESSSSGCCIAARLDIAGSLLRDGSNLIDLECTQYLQKRDFSAVIGLARQSRILRMDHPEREQLFDRNSLYTAMDRK